MNTYGDYIGAGGGDSYLRDKAALRAVKDASQEIPAPAYGYSRTPRGHRVFPFSDLEVARTWFEGLIQDPYFEYVAVFAAPDLSHPVPGLESFGHPVVMGEAHVGGVLPFLLGLPLGALGGYFYRGWHDEHPGRWIPGIGGCSVGGPWLDVEPYGDPYVGAWADLAGPYVGAPWVDIAGNNPYVGSPWVDLVGIDKRAWPRTRALIESAKHAVLRAQWGNPAAAWVWILSPPGPSVVPGVEIDPQTTLTAFSSLDRAQAYMFEQLQGPHIAAALFDTMAVHHWPNPVRWTQSDDPTYEPMIAQHLGESNPVRTAGSHVGADPQGPSINTALRGVRDRAQTIANKRAGNVVGVIHTVKDNLWHAMAFRDRDDADDWLSTATQDQAGYTYAAYYDRDDATWPNAVTEKIGGFRAPKVSGALVGGPLDDVRAHAKALASAKPGNAAGVIRSVDGLWSTFAFPNLDAAIDWLSSLTATSLRGSFTYAGAFEKDAQGTAYVQQEEFGTGPVPASQRALATTRGEHSWGGS